MLYPDIGRAGMPYARNVRSDHRFTSLPEPGLVFDALFKARDVSGRCFTFFGFVRCGLGDRQRRVHPSGASSLSYAFAQLVAYVRSLLRRSMMKPNL